MRLWDQFVRRYRLTGSRTTVKQYHRLLKNYFFPFLEERTTLKYLDHLNQDFLNGFYNFIQSHVRKGEMSKSYAKDCLYAVNKFISVFNRKHKKNLKQYDVSAFLATLEGFKHIKVSAEEYENIKQWRNLYGKVPPPEKIN
ncbi:hypothetical protein DEFDS_0871 [Deferribacter desulfuricans SSM1]|uniref:Core-binding (CB) domain-containing protein n=1 Tax=Deferribacter desulfuricans (strain DSM 14783 / JCM 11476 / NBRC 101012 / SSM1) TaxID=639282 RepID=D3PCM4_DEFDS|nr:hypothetical protein [Deferribacter desulfuricans]BAI80347.1 hypothetical protein DEFDS_0871 [Deferribacter desulfuricans SSM1]